MIVRAMTTSNATSERRTTLYNAAMRVKMIRMAISRGLSTADATSHVDNSLRSSRERRQASELFDAADADEAAPANALDTTEGTDGGSTHTDDAVDCAAHGPASSMSSGETPSLQGHHDPAGNPAPPVEETIAAVRDAAERDLASMTSIELRRFVEKHSAHFADDSTDPRNQRDSATAAVEVASLATSMAQTSDLNDDMISRVESLSDRHHKALSAAVHKQSLVHVARQVLDMLHYIVFIGVFVATTMHGRQDDSTFKMTLSLMAQLQDKPWPARVTSVTKTFRDSVESIEELHKYLLGGFYDVVYAGGSFDGDFRFPSGSAYSPRGVLGGYGEIWGPIRIGQVRVKGIPCSGQWINSTALLHNDTTPCYPEYSADTASHEAYGRHEGTYTFDSGPADDEPTMISHSARVYPAPGFNIYLPNRESAACDHDTFEHCAVYDQLKAIEENKFFDRATRAVFVDMTVYNRNFRDVSLVRLYVEAYPAGGMEARGVLQTERLYAYSWSHDGAKIVGEVVVLVAVTHQLYRSFRAPPLTGRHVSNRLHVFNLVLFYVIAVCKWLSHHHLPDPATISPMTFLNFRTSAQFFWAGECVASIVCLLAWIKMFYYLSFVPKFAQLIKTISKASKEMGGLMLIFVIALVGSAMAFNMAFGMRLHNYHTFWRSFLTLVQVIINKVEFEDLVETNQVLGPVFFCLFVVLMLFVILNMFIVIITDAYIDAQRELQVMQDVHLNVSSRVILHHLWHEEVLTIPWVGRNIFQPLHNTFVRAADYVQTLRHDPAPTKRIVHEGTVAAELEAVVRMKHGASMHHAKAAKATPQAPIETLEGVAAPVHAEDAQVDERVRTLPAAILLEYADSVRAIKAVLADKGATDEAATRAISGHLAREMSVSQSKAREQLVQSALHAQIVQQGVERGLSVATATADADAAMEATFQVPRSQRSDAISLSAHEQTPITTMSNNTPRATPSPNATAALTDPGTPLFLQRSASSDRVIATDSAGPSVAENDPSSRPSAVVASLTKLRSLSSRDLHSIVRHACRSQVAAKDEITPNDRIVVEELAATLRSGKLTPDVADRVKALSAPQHKLLTALVKEQSKERLAREFLDMVRYVVFLSLFLVVSMYGRHDDTPYKMTQSLMDQLQDKPWPARISATTKTFRDSVDCIEELHSYLLGSFYDVVYSGGSFDGDSRFPTGKSYSARGVVGGYNEIWGPIRIGQLRVQGVECSGTLVNASFIRNEPRLCYPEYSDATASRETYGWPNAIYSHDAAPGAVEPTFFSRSARAYPAPAFTVFLPNRESSNCNATTFENCDVYSRLKTIQATKFFDRATRVVFIDMTVYNRHVRDVSLIRLYVEAFPSGGMAPRGEFQTARLYAYTTTEDFQRTGVEILIVVVVTYELVKEWRARARGVLATLHVANLVLFYLVAALKFVSYMSLPYPSEINDHTFHSFRLSAQYYWLAEAVTSVVCLLAWIKLFHFLSFMPKFAQLIKTVERAAAEMFGLLMIFGISLVGSAMAFNMTFGVRLYNYHTFWRSFLTLTQVIIMKVDFEDLVETNQMLGPAFFCLFVVLMLFVILNMFIVVTTDAYSSAQRDIHLMEDIQLNVMSMDIVLHVLHTVVFEVPVLGRRVFKPCFALVSKWIQSRHPNDKTEATVQQDLAIAEIETVKQGYLAGARPKAPDNSAHTRDGVPESAASGGCREAAADGQVDTCLASLRLAVAATRNDPVKLQILQAHLAQWQELLETIRPRQ